MNSKVEAAPGPVLALEQEASLALVQASRSVLGAYRRLLEPLGLTHPQYLVLVSLGQHGPLSVKELGRLLHLESATLSPLLKRLESGGLLIRRRSPRDERVVVVTLTEQGRALHARAAAVPETITELLGAGGIDMDHLFAVLRGVVTAVGAEPATGAAPAARGHR